MKIAMIGTGYVGLVAGAGLADFGNDVTCCDRDRGKIEFLRAGGIPIYEIGLSDLLKRNMEKGRLKFSCDLKAATERSQVIFLAVGTPEGDNGEPDISDILEVCDEIGGYIDDYRIVAIKSTVPAGTFQTVREHIAIRARSEFDVVSNPEFLREGSAVQDFLHPNRIVIGTASEKAAAVMREVYRGLYLIETPMIITDNMTAEIIKYASNGFLATKISYINEIASVCDRLGADIVTVAKAMGMDGRIGQKFLHPSPGFGGSCLVKDVAGFIASGNRLGLDMAILKAVREVNRSQRQLVIDKARAMLGEISGKRAAILGLAFKSGTDDIRNSPSLYVVEKLLAMGAEISAYDPAAMENFGRRFPDLAYCQNAYDACQDADIAIFMTEWNEFRELDLRELKTVMRGDCLLDPRNIYLPELAKRAGFRYLGFGRN